MNDDEETETDVENDDEDRVLPRQTSRGPCPDEDRVLQRQDSSSVCGEEINQLQWQDNSTAYRDEGNVSQRQDVSFTSRNGDNSVPQDDAAFACRGGDSMAQVKEGSFAYHDGADIMHRHGSSHPSRDGRSLVQWQDAEGSSSFTSRDGIQRVDNSSFTCRDGGSMMMQRSSAYLDGGSTLRRPDTSSAYPDGSSRLLDGSFGCQPGLNRTVDACVSTPHQQHRGLQPMSRAASMSDDGNAGPLDLTGHSLSNYDLAAAPVLHRQRSSAVNDEASGRPLPELLRIVLPTVGETPVPMLRGAAPVSVAERCPM